MLLATGESPDALRELEAASKIDPAHPGIMQMLGRVAMEQGEFDRAERMFRSLMLVVGRDEDPAGFLGAGRDGHDRAGVAQDPAREPADLIVVVDHEDPDRRQRLRHPVQE